MAVVNAGIEKHLATGGCLCIFPEGKLNRAPESILPLRYGSMAVAADKSLAVVSLVSVGETALVYWCYHNRLNLGCPVAQRLCGPYQRCCDLCGTLQRQLRYRFAPTIA